VNENDTVATEEIKLGDNDTLAALVTNLIEAELMVLLTDQGGLYERNPRIDPNATLIREWRAGDPILEQMASGEAGHVGRGGMLTKVRAAARAARSGAATVIASGREDRVLDRIAQGEPIGTLLLPRQETWAARKQWLAGQLQVRGRLKLDDGAARVLREAGRSLLPIGVKAVEGEFTRGELVACDDPEGREVARGLINYSAAEARKIIGHPSTQIEQILGYVDEPELIHRDNLVLI
jgi:glutamate 5-kinase